MERPGCDLPEVGRQLGVPLAVNRIERIGDAVGIMSCEVELQRFGVDAAARFSESFREAIGIAIDRIR